MDHIKLLDAITPEQFAEIYNDPNAANQQQVRDEIERVYGIYVGRHKLLTAISTANENHPGLLISRRDRYDKARSIAQKARKESEAQKKLDDESQLLEPALAHRLVIENTAMAKELRELRQLTAQDATFEMLWKGLASHQVSAPKWLTPRTTPKHQAIPTAFLSDTHFDEVVAANEINYVNCYDRQIAEKRLLKFGDSTIRLTRDYYGPMFNMKTLIMPWGGDMVGGNIHEELKVTNADAIMGTVHHWITQLVGLVELLLTHFEQIYIPCVVGNHGRNSRKPIAKGRVRDNFDWLLYKQVEYYFHGTEAQRKRYSGLTFDISEGTECRYRVFDTRYQLTHGDQFRGGQGWGGVAVPIMKGHHKKKERETATRSPFDIMILGHFHQLLDLGNTVVNGCFTGDTLIQTLTGVSTIKNVEIGTIVLSREGTYETVSHKFVKESLQGLVKIKVRGLPELLKVTPQHLVWALKGETKSSQSSPRWRKEIGMADAPQWVPADFISPGDYVHIPRNVGAATPFDEELAWVYGLFVAEGHTIVDGGASGKHNRIEFSLHIDEYPWLERAKVRLDALFGKDGRLWVREERTTSHLSYSGRDIAQEWRGLFGHTSANKKFPHEWFGLAPNLLLAVLQGWLDGDGCTSSDPAGYETTSATTISTELAYGMFRLALSAGLRPSLAKVLKGGPRKSDSYTLHFNAGQESVEIDGDLFYRVHHRFRTDEVTEVFDLEVTGGHTYTAGFVGVHNSLKGYDEYAALNNFGFEEPRQAFWLTDPKHGKTFFSPIHVRTSKEGWVDESKQARQIAEL